MGDGAKYAGSIPDYLNVTVTSAVVSEGVVDLSTGEQDEDGDEIGVFQCCQNCATVTLCQSLRKIGECAFWQCRSLVRVDIPPGVDEIGKRAFLHCHSLQDVTIPEGIVNLPDGVFYGCAALKSIALPSSLRTIGDNA